MSKTKTILDGIRASNQIKKALPATRIIMFTLSDDDDKISDTLKAGADGYCFKDVSAQHLHSAIKAVAMGVSWLEPGIADKILRGRKKSPDKVAPTILELNCEPNQDTVACLINAPVQNLQGSFVSLVEPASAELKSGTILSADIF